MCSITDISFKDICTIRDALHDAYIQSKRMAEEYPGTLLGENCTKSSAKYNKLLQFFLKIDLGSAYALWDETWK